jgi:type 1 glutamine amidotransferase
MAEKLQYSEAEAVRGALTAIQNGDVPAAMKEQAEALREKLVDYAGRLLKDWDFDAGNAGWIAENDTGITSQNGVLRVDLLGDDPFISTAVSVPGGVFDVQMRIRAPEESETWQIFYGSDEKPLGQPPFWSVNFEAPADAQWHEVSTQLAVDGNLTEFRIDPGLGPNHVEFDWIRLLRSQSDAAKTPTPAAKPETGAKSFSSDAAARILLIGTPPDHPHGTHMYIHECGLLAKCLEQSPGVDAVVSLGWPADEVLVDAANAIVLYSSPGAEIVLRGNHADRFRALMQKGVGLTAIHWSTGIADANDKELEQEYLHYLGGIFSFGFSGLDMVHTDVDQVVPDHPICRGWSNYEQFDEIYLDIQVLDDATPLEKVYVKDKEQVVAWTYERPNANGGRSYGNTLGHFHENFWITSFRRSLVNGILWTAHYEVPKDGAPCAVLPEDMVLIEPEPAKE